MDYKKAVEDLNWMVNNQKLLSWSDDLQNTFMTALAALSIVENMPTEEEIKKIIAKGLWDAIGKYMPQCTEDDGSIDENHHNCPVYAWVDDENKYMKTVAHALAQRIGVGR